MKKSILLFVSLILVIGMTGCNKKPVENQVVTNEPVDNQNQTVEDQNDNGENDLSEGNVQEEVEICKNEQLGLELSYPKDWIKCITTSEGFGFITKEEPFEAGISAHVIVNDKDDINYYKDKKKSCRYEEMKDKEIFYYCEARRGQAWSNGVIIDDNLYLFVWETFSDEPMPDDVDGIWVPKSGVSKEDVINILKTINTIVK